MCIGIPMQVLEVETFRALCSDGAQAPQWVDIRLLDQPQPGEWLLVSLGAARELISAVRAAQIRQALTALAAINQGEASTVDMDHLFADLLEQTPQLPPHLQAQWAANRTSKS